MRYVLSGTNVRKFKIGRKSFRSGVVVAGDEAGYGTNQTKEGYNTTDVCPRCMSDVETDFHRF